MVGKRRNRKRTSAFIDDGDDSDDKRRQHSSRFRHSDNCCCCDMTRLYTRSSSNVMSVCLLHSSVSCHDHSILKTQSMTLRWMPSHLVLEVVQVAFPAACSDFVPIEETRLSQRRYSPFPFG